MEPTKGDEMQTMTEKKKTAADAAKEARRAYKRKWNAEHKDKVKQYQQKYWERRAAKLAEGEQ